FHTLSDPQDYFKIKLSVDNGGFLTLDLLNSVEIRAYNGDDIVFSQRLQDGLLAGVDILVLLKSDQPVTIPFGPGVPFDKVAIGLNSTVALNAFSSPLKVYSIKRFNTTTCPD